MVDKHSPLAPTINSSPRTIADAREPPRALSAALTFGR
jgi:hypothetical protein